MGPVSRMPLRPPASRRMKVSTTVRKACSCELPTLLANWEIHTICARPMHFTTRSKTSGQRSNSAVLRRPTCLSATLNFIGTGYQRRLKRRSAISISRRADVSGLPICTATFFVRNVNQTCRVPNADSTGVGGLNNAFADRICVLVEMDGQGRVSVHQLERFNGNAACDAGPGRLGYPLDQRKFWPHQSSY